MEGHLGGEGLLPGGAEALPMPRDLTCNRGALPETPGLTWGAGMGGGRRGKGQSSPRGGGAGRRAALTMRSSPRLGARGSGPPGWPGLGEGGAPGGRRPPRPGFAAAATCLHRDQLLPPLRREGEGAGLWSRRPP